MSTFGTPVPGVAPAGDATTKTYLMCPPEYFDVTYEINAWMNIAVPVDQAKALAQWNELVDTYSGFGHTVHLLDPVDGLPDMVFSANGAFSVDGTVLGARFKHAEREREAAEHARWYADHGWTRFTAGVHVNEGEGDYTYLAGRGLVLAGHGFRTDPLSHAEAQEVLGRPVIGLRLVDPRFYHLDVALFALDDTNVCYYPGAFGQGSRRVLEQLFPEAVIATEDDALAFGLNAVSDGRNVVLPVGAHDLSHRLSVVGYNTVMVDLSELHKGGGSVKCCTAELRS